MPEIVIREKNHDAVVIWQKAIPLSSAPQKLIPPETWDQIQGLYKESRSKFMKSLDEIGSAVKQPQGIRSWEEALGKLCNSEIQEPREKADFAVSRIKEEIVKAIRTGQIVAVGYAMPRTPQTLPSIIPDDVLSGSILWEKSEIKGNGLHYVVVRLYDMSSVLDEVRANHADAKKTIPLGRKGYKQEVINAFIELRDAGVIDLSKPKKRAYAPIRELLSKKFPDKSGSYMSVSNETIRSYISSFYDE